MMKPTDHNFVRAATCRVRSRATTWLLGGLLVLMGFFLTQLLNAADRVQDAERLATDVASGLKAHIAAQTEQERHIEKRLDEIKTDVRENRHLLEQLMRNNGSRRQKTGD